MGPGLYVYGVCVLYFIFTVQYIILVSIIYHDLTFPLPLLTHPHQGSPDHCWVQAPLGLLSYSHTRGVTILRPIKQESSLKPRSFFYGSCPVRQ